MIRNLPFAVSIYWHLPVVILLISLVYSATRFEHWGAIVQEAWRWGLRMLGFLVAIAAVLYLVAWLI
jgi:hypothetical protein